MNYEFINLYFDLLTASFTVASATCFSCISKDQVSNDQITTFLRTELFDSKSLWKIAKPLVRKIESESGFLIIDDSISEKPYTDENEIICWHYDHKTSRSVKGLCFASLLYFSNKNPVPVGCESVSKKKMELDLNTGNMKRKSTDKESKHTEKSFIFNFVCIYQMAKVFSEKFEKPFCLKRGITSSCCTGGLYKICCLKYTLYVR